MELDPYEHGDLILEGTTNLKNHTEPVLAQIYRDFINKLENVNNENMNNANGGFRLLNHNHFGIRKVTLEENRSPEVTYETLIMAILFNGRDYYIFSRDNFVYLFQSLFLTLKDDINTNTQITELNYCEYLTALPLTVYEKTTNGEPSRSDNALIWMLQYSCESVGSIPVPDIKEVLGSIFDRADSERIRTLFSQIYSESVTPTVYESSVQGLFQDHVIHPIVRFLSYPGQKITLEPQAPIMVDTRRIFGLQVGAIRSIVPDLVIKLQGRPILVGEMKSFPIFGTHSNFESLLSDENYSGLFKQILAYMIALGVTRGFLSDSQSTCFIEIDSGKLEKVDDIMNLPLKGTLMDNQSSCPSLLQMLMYFIYKSKSEDVNFHEKISEVGYFSVNPDFYQSSGLSPTSSRSMSSRSMSNTMRSKALTDSSYRENDGFSYGTLTSDTGYENKYKVIEQHKGTPLSINSDHMAQLIKVSASTIKELTEGELDDSVTVVVKIFDKRFPKIRKLHREDIEYLCDEYYETEKWAIEILSKDPNFNNIYLNHGDKMVAYHVNFGIYFTGNFILSRFIKASPLPKDETTYKKLKEQLDIMHSHNIVHGDLSERNILYDADTQTPYIIDYDHCKIAEGEKSSLFNGDDRRLKEIFKMN